MQSKSPLAATEYFDLPFTTTSLQWAFSMYAGYGGAGDKTVGYTLMISNNFDVDDFKDRFLLKVNSPVLPEGPLCPDQVPYHQLNDFGDRQVGC